MITLKLELTLDEALFLKAIVFDSAYNRDKSIKGLRTAFLIAEKRV